MLVGQEIAGFTPSFTTTNCSQVAALPAASVAVHTTTVVPTGYTEGALLVIVGVPQLSVAVAVPSVTLIAVQPEFVVVLISAGQVMTGGSLSITVTVCAQAEELLEPSTTVHVTVVGPSG
jgi:hypothetical protein